MPPPVPTTPGGSPAGIATTLRDAPAPDGRTPVRRPARAGSRVCAAGQYRLIRPGPGAPGANGARWVRIGERAKHRRRGGAVMKMIRLRRRLRQPRPRVARRRPGAVGAGRPGPVPDGTGPVGGQDETDPHRGGVRYSSGGAPKCRKIDGEPAGRPGPCTHPSKKSPAPIIPAGVRILTRRAAHRTLADLLRRLNPAIRGWRAHPPARGLPGARSATSTTSPSGEYSAGAPERHPRLNKHTVNRRFLPGWRIRDDEIEFLRASRVPVTRYRYRGTRIPNPPRRRAPRHDNRWRAGRAPMRTSGSQGRPVETHPRTRGQGVAGRPHTYIRTWDRGSFIWPPSPAAATRESRRLRHGRQHEDRPDLRGHRVWPCAAAPTRRRSRSSTRGRGSQYTSQ